MTKYNKLIYTGITALLLALGNISLALSDGSITATEWIAAVSVFLTPIATVLAPTNSLSLAQLKLAAGKLNCTITNKAE